MEFVVLALLFVPSLVAFGLWIFKRTNISLTGDTAPIDYWGSYSTVHEHGPGVHLPHLKTQETESESHAHTITVHP